MLSALDIKEERPLTLSTVAMSHFNLRAAGAVDSTEKVQAFLYGLQPAHGEKQVPPDTRRDMDVDVVIGT